MDEKLSLVVEELFVASLEVDQGAQSQELHFVIEDPESSCKTKAVAVVQVPRLTLSAIANGLTPWLRGT